MLLHRPAFFLLEQTLSRHDVVRIAIACGALLAVLIIAFFVVSRLRRRLQEPDRPAAGAGFTLSDLRQLHKSGQMSTEEFERAKAKVVESARRAAERADALRPEASRADKPRGLF